MGSGRDTLDQVRHIEGADGHALVGRRRLLYRVTGAVLSLVVGLAVVDTAGLAAVYGVRTASVRAAGGGYHLEVRHPQVARPGLAAPFEVTVVRPGGFEGPVTVAVTSHYLAMWDANGLDPEPASSTTDDDRLIWEFEPPPRGDTLVVSFDARIEPGVQRGRSGRVEVVDDRGRPLATAAFHTRVMP